MEPEKEKPLSMVMVSPEAALSRAVCRVAWLFI
jgi:hypothetical protein